MIEEHEYISRSDLQIQRAEVAPVIDYGLEQAQLDLIKQSPGAIDIFRKAASARSERGGRAIDHNDLLVALLDGAELGGILSRAGHFPSAIRLQLSEILSEGTSKPDAGNRDYTLTPSAQRILSAAISEASARGHAGEGAVERGYSGAGGIHVLNAIIRDEVFPEVGARLNSVGVNPEQVRELAAQDLNGLRPMLKTDLTTPFD